MSDKARTSPRVAAEAGDILRDRRFGMKPKSVAGSALSQAPSRKMSLKKLAGGKTSFSRKTLSR